MTPEQREYEAWREERRLLMEEREQEREDRAADERAAQMAERLRRMPRAVVDGGLGLSVAPFPVDPTIEGNFRFEVGAGVQWHPLRLLGMQGLVLYGFNGVTRPNTTTIEMRSFLTTFHEATFEHNLLFGPFGRFQVALGVWHNIGGYDPGSVRTIQSGRPGTSVFPDQDALGDPVVSVGPNIKMGAYLGKEHRMALGGRIQPGGILTNSLGSVLRLGAYFSVFLP